MTHKPLVLTILDGFGYSKNEKDNAIAKANTPFFDDVYKNAAWTTISGSGKDVGLPHGQMGNSEVGHLNIGAGRIIQQDFTRIGSEIDTGEFFKNTALVNAVNKAKENDKAVHIMGLLSPGGVHSHEDQIHAMVELAAKQGCNKVYMHAFLDGRDTPPRSALDSLNALEEKMQSLKCGRIVSMIGRYFAMDRDKRWDRVQQAYDLMVNGIAVRSAPTPEAGLQAAYDNDENDEFVKGTSIGESAVTIQDGDAVIFMNYRADRAREITHALTDEHFDGFDRTNKPELADYVMLTEYDATFNLSIAYPPASYTNVLGEVLANNGLKQLRIAETEKYAHVTFFFNGGVETPFDGEVRELISSPKVATYDLQPEMSAPELTDKLIAAIESQDYDVIICNYANPDMVGHTGVMSAAVRAIETIDTCMSRVNDALKKVDGELLITADHGNAEKMFNDDTGQAHTAHTSEPVPFIYLGSRKLSIAHNDGALYDIAPTMLCLLGIDKPSEMTGKSLLKKE